MTDIGKAIEIFFSDGEVKELRILTAGGMMSGFFDHRLKLGQAAKFMGGGSEDEGVKAVYWTLNPINRSTLKHISNELRIRPTYATRTGNIEKRSWMMIDIDAKRESGTNATDSEKADAKMVLDTVVTFLKSKDWPDPVVVDSGNGYHALYRINVPAADTETVRNVLRVLAWKFDSSGAKVDQSVHDAVRICKVPGTWVRKGPHSAERPHRLSALLSVPPVIKTVPMTSLINIKRFAPPAKATLRWSRLFGQVFRVFKWNNCSS
jgi:hypothetical protein